MQKLDILKRLDGNSFRLLAFLSVKADKHGTIHNYNSEYVEYIQNELRIGYQTAYKGLRILEKEEFIERHGQKNYIKLKERLF